MKDFKDRFNKLLIDKLGVNQEDIKPNAKFTEDLGADSLDTEKNEIRIVNTLL